MHDPRAAPAAAVHPARHLRPLRLRAWSTCPATATTPRSASGSPTILQRRARRRVRRVHRPGQRVRRLARVHFVVRPPRGRRSSPRSTSPSSSAGSPRPPAPGTTTSPPRVIAEFGEEAGVAPGPALRSTPSPRPTRRTSRRAPASVDLGRLEAIQGDAAASTSRSTSRSTPAGARPGSRSSAIGAPLSLSRDPADALVDGGRGRRRAALRAGGPATGPVVHLRVRAALRPRPARATRASSSRTRCARSGTGYNEIDGFNALVLARRPDLAAGDRAAGLREVHEAGQHPVRARLHRGGAAQQRRHHPAAGAALRGPVRPGPQRPGRPTPRRARRRSRTIAATHRAGPRRRGQPRPRPDPALLPDPHPGHPAHQLLPARPPTASIRALHLVQARARRRSPTCPSRGRRSRSSSTPRASRACTCASARSPAAACAGRTAATTSAPRCSAWSRRRW